MLSFQQLNTPYTEAQAEAVIIQRLSEIGFASKGWQSGSAQLTFVKLGAWGFSAGSRVVQALLRAAFNELSTGDFLTRFSYSHYDNIRAHAVAFRYACTLTVAAGEGPHTVEAGDIVATNGVHFYRNVDDGGVTYPVDLTDAAPVMLTLEAEKPGRDQAAGDGTITTLVTSLAGVTIDNPEPSLIRAGSDEESDAALRARNRTKWALLAVDMPEDGYTNTALGALPNGRIAVDSSNPRGPGTVDIYIAGESDAAGVDDVTAVDEAIQARRAVTADVEVIAAAATSVVVSGIVYARAPATIPAVREAVKSYVNALPIGGMRLTPSTNGVPEDGITAAIHSVAGVQNVDLTSPLVDIHLPDFGIARATDGTLAGLVMVQV
jgi:uncharacterized phage protein gp47/JayE